MSIIVHTKTITQAGGPLYLILFKTQRKEQITIIKCTYTLVITQKKERELNPL